MSDRGDPSRSAQAPGQRAELPSSPAAIAGYVLPASNVHHWPNQWFDVLLKHRSRGCTLVVTHMFLQGLSNRGPDGYPYWQDLHFTPPELGERCGISRMTAARALAEAEQNGFIRCVRRARTPAGKRARPSVYRLSFLDPLEGTQPAYETDPERFEGFLPIRCGCWTPTPKLFLEHTVFSERHAIVKVVGAIIRETAGWADGALGHRKLMATMSLAQLRQSTGLGIRHIRDAVAEATVRGHLRVVEEGVFDKDAGRGSRPATYGLNWIEDDGIQRLPTAKSTEPDQKGYGSTSSKGARDADQKGHGPPFKRGTALDQKGHGIQRTTSKETAQQQSRDGGSKAPSSDVVVASVIAALIQEGVSPDKAARLATTSTDEARRQLDWLPKRRVDRNRAGMLVRAIEQGWTEPEAGGGGGRQPPQTAAHFVAHFYAAAAGNEGDPVAEPSAVEASQAEGFIRQIEQVAPGVDLTDLARRFAQHVVDVPVQYRTFQSALRRYGDAFVQQQRGERSAAERRRGARRSEELEEARERHQARHEHTYAAYLAERAGDLAQRAPDAWARFIEHESSQREAVASSPLLKGVAPTLRRRFLGSFDGAFQRAERLREFFPEQVLDFWAWDARHNAERFALEEPCE